MSEVPEITIGFETKEGDQYMIPCKVLPVCDKNKCSTIYMFPDGKIFNADEERSRENMYIYIKTNYTPMVKKS